MKRQDHVHFDAKHCVCHPHRLTKRLMSILLLVLRRFLPFLLAFFVVGALASGSAFAQVQSQPQTQSPPAKTDEAVAISEINAHLIELKAIDDQVQNTTVVRAYRSKMAQAQWFAEALKE